LTTKGGSSLVSTRHFVPANCLSCGRGDANFIPALPHVQGTDGKLYRMDGSIVKGNSIGGNFNTG